MQRHILSFLALPSCLLGTAATASAQEPPAPTMVEAEHEPDDGHRFYLSISPIHLLAPIVEVTAELRLSDKLGLAAVAGAGRLPLEEDGEEDSVSAFEVGSQLIAYPIGDFNHGLQVGGEIMYLHLASDGETETLSGSAQGLAVGPFVGYKLATDVGFSFNVQAGAQYVAARGEDDEGESYGSAVVPLVNANLGWSF